jgi:predicted DNA-binding transcriptional regulator AlpA
VTETETVAVDELVGMAEIAKLIGVTAPAVRQYRARGILPEPLVTLAIGPIWRRSDIVAWQASRPGKGWRRAAA